MGFAALSNPQVLLAFFFNNAYIQHAAYTIAYSTVVGYNFHADAND